MYVINFKWGSFANKRCYHKKSVKQKERKEEDDLGKNMNCFSQHLNDDSCFEKKKLQTFFEPLYLFLQNLLNLDRVTSRIKSILIEKWLSMIFTGNSLATEECECQYKSKKMLLTKRMIQICQLNKIKIVSEEHQHWGDPFLFVSFPYFSLSKAELLFVIHILKLGYFHLVQSVSVHFLKDAVFST